MTLYLKSPRSLRRELHGRAVTYKTIFIGAQQSNLLTLAGEVIRRRSPERVIIEQGETNMGDKGSKDKGKKETQKKAQHTLKEKRKLKKEKKDKKEV